MRTFPRKGDEANVGQVDRWWGESNPATFISKTHDFGCLATTALYKAMLERRYPLTHASYSVSLGKNMLWAQCDE